MSFEQFFEHVQIGGETSDFLGEFSHQKNFGEDELHPIWQRFAYFSGWVGEKPPTSYT